MRGSRITFVALIVGLLASGATTERAWAQPKPCATPAAPVPPGPPPGAPKGTKLENRIGKFEPLTVVDAQDAIDAERAKVSNTRFHHDHNSEGVTHGGGDKSKMSPTELAKWQTGINDGTADFLRAGLERPEHRAAILKNAVKKGIRDSRTLDYSQNKELIYDLNRNGKLSPAEEAERARLGQKTTYSCLKGECPPDYSKPDVFRKNDLGNLGAFFNKEPGFKPSGTGAPVPRKPNGEVDIEKLLEAMPKPDPANVSDREKVLGEWDRSAANLRKTIIEAGLEMTDPEARTAAASLIQGPKFDPNEIFARKLGDATNTEAKGDMKRLGDLLRAKALSADPKWAAYVTPKEIDGKIADLLKNQNTVDKLNQLRADANEETKKTYGYQAQLRYAKSEDFWNKIVLSGDEAGKKLVADEVAKIAVVDPAAAKELLDQLQDRFTAKLIDDMSEDKLIDHLAKIENHLGGDGANLAKILKGSTDVTKRSAKVSSTIDAVKQLIKARAARGAAPEDAIKALKESKLGDTLLGHSLAKLGELDAHGKVSGSAAGIGLLISGIDLLDGSLGKGTKKDVDAVLSILKAADAYDAFAKWGSWQFAGKELAKDAAILKSLAGLKKLGPAADIIGGVVDTSRGIMSFHEGNADKGTWQLIGAGGQFATAAGTILILAGASGPGAPVVILVGTVVVVIAKIGEYNSAKAPEVEFLRESNLLAAMPKDIASRVSLQERIKSYERDIATAQRNIENANYVLNRPHGARQSELDNARNVKESNRGYIWSAEAEIEKAKKELDLVEKRLKDANINPSDWDGFSPQERLDRAERERKWKAAGEKHYETQQNMHRMGAPVGR